jgi:hypothetical protein
VREPPQHHDREDSASAHTPRFAQLDSPVVFQQRWFLEFHVIDAPYSLPVGDEVAIFGVSAGRDLSLSH